MFHKTLLPNSIRTFFSCLVSDQKAQNRMVKGPQRNVKAKKHNTVKKRKVYKKQ